MRRSEAGFTMVEMIIAIVIISFGLIALVGTVPGLIKVAGLAREKQIALSACRSKLDEMRAVGFPNPNDPSQTSFFNTYPQGTTFTATGLPMPSTGNQGQIIYLTEEAAALAFSDPIAKTRFLAGDANWFTSAIPFDADLDGFPRETQAPHILNQIWPVMITVRWKNELGVDQTADLVTILYRTKQ